MKLKMTFLLITGIMFLAGCTEDDHLTTVTSKVAGGSWKVSYYWDKDKDETHKFQGYTFDFRNDQTLEINTGTSMEYGTWNFDTSDDSHDHFILQVPLTDPIEELHDDWKVISISDQKIELKDESGSGGIEYLTFQK